MSRARRWLLGKSYNAGFMEQFQEQFRSGLFSRPYLTRSLRSMPPGVLNAAFHPGDFYIHPQHSLFPEDYFYRKLVKERLPILQYETLSPYINLYTMRSSASLAQRMAFDWYKNIEQRFQSEDAAYQNTIKTFEKPLKELVEKLRPFAGDAAAELTLKMPYTQSLLCRVHARRVEIAAATYSKKVNSLVKLGLELRTRGWKIPRLANVMVVVDSGASMVDQLIFYLRLAAQDLPMNRVSMQKVKIRVGEEEKLVDVFPLQYKAIETLLTDSLKKEYRKYRLAARLRAGKPDFPLDEVAAEEQEKRELISGVQSEALYNADDVLLCRFRENESPFTESTLEAHRILRHVLVKQLRFKHEKSVNQHLIQRILDEERKAGKKEEDDKNDYGMLALSRGRLPKEFARLCTDSQLFVMDMFRWIHDVRYEDLQKMHAMPFVNQTTYPGYHENVGRMLVQDKKEKIFFETSELIQKREELLEARKTAVKAAEEAKAKRKAAQQAAQEAAKQAAATAPTHSSAATPPSAHPHTPSSSQTEPASEDDLQKVLDLLEPEAKKK